MPRPKSESLASVFAGLKETMTKAMPAKVRKIPSILEFCDSPKYLGLPERGINLFPMQRLTLKAFYRGSEGNENVEFTPEEIAYLEEVGLNGPERGNVLAKLHTDTIFRELVLVWGRGSGKDFFVSLIALYEAMKLLETPGGDPYAYYNLPRGGNPITILTVATAAPQASLAFNEIKSKLLQSEYFKDKIIPDGLGAGLIHLLSPQDKIDNEDRRSRGLQPDKGGIVIRTGHSNSDSLLGIQCFVLIMDEVASFKQTDGASGGHRIYEAMMPSLGRFVRKVPVLDADKKPVLKPDGTAVDPESIFDSKIISISSPRGKEGILWEMFSKEQEHPKRLAIRLPTWIVNTKYTREMLRTEYKAFSEESFMMEFGAEFSATAGSNFFVEQRVDMCFANNRKFREYGSPGIMYFAHLDPATTNNNYALAIVHKEMATNRATGRADFVVILDHLKVWSPIFDGKQIRPVVMDDVEKYLLQMNRMFHIGLVTYDMFNSLSTLKMLGKIGMPCKLTHYSKQYKMQIYSELEKMINEGRLIMPYDDLLRNELVNLQRRYDSGRGFSVLPNKEADCQTDDCADALAGAVFNCLRATHTSLPASRLVSMPSTMGGNMRNWMTMQGVSMGYGTGPDVASRLTNRQPMQSNAPFGFQGLWGK